MEIDEDCIPLNVIELIRNIQKSGSTPNRNSQKHCFPYLETFCTPSIKENHQFSKSNRFGNNFIYSDTLKFRDNSYSLNRLFKNCDFSTKVLRSPSKKKESRPLTVKRSILNHVTRVYSPISGNDSPQGFLLKKIEPRIRKSISKWSKIKPIFSNGSNRMTPDILKINKISRLNSENLKPIEKSATRAPASKSKPRPKPKNRRLVIELESVGMLDDSMKNLPISRKMTEVDESGKFK